MKNDLHWTKTILTVYRYLERICGGMDKIIMPQEGYVNQSRFLSLQESVQRLLWSIIYFAGSYLILSTLSSHS